MRPLEERPQTERAEHVEEHDRALAVVVARQVAVRYLSDERERLKREPRHRLAVVLVVDVREDQSVQDPSGHGRLHPMERHVSVLARQLLLDSHEVLILRAALDRHLLLLLQPF